MSKTASAYGRFSRARFAYRPVSGERKSGIPAEVLIPAPVFGSQTHHVTDSNGYGVSHHDHDFLDILLFDILSHRFDGSSVDRRGRSCLIDGCGGFIAHVDAPATSTRVGMTVSPTATYDCEEMPEQVGWGKKARSLEQRRVWLQR